VEASFSGHRGYHVHVEKKAIQELDSVARKEIVDYVTGVGLEATLHGIEETGLRKPRIVSGPGLDDTGWRGRVARGTREFFSAATEEELEGLGLRKKTVDEILSKKHVILESWKKGGPWSLVLGLGTDNWRAVVQKGLESQSVKIDTVVTTDIHRLIRLPNSLHGKTGLLKVLFPTRDVEKFDPLKNAIAFKKGEAVIDVEEAPEFRLGEERFGPFKKQKVELPMAAALFLLCKDAAKVMD
jgi:DNA primase small subunit